MQTSTPVKINRNDIFNFVVQNTNYDPIEKVIDPVRYEVLDTFIYDHIKKIQLDQSDEYCSFCRQVNFLRQNAPKMERSEIERICDELAEISPTELYL
jgi:hypothetical protein